MEYSNEGNGGLDLGEKSAQGADTPGAGTPLASGPAASSPYEPTATTMSSRTSSQPTPARTLYVPQFSVATQMILKRMRGEPGGLTSALASVTAPGVPRPKFPQTTYDSVRERIISSISTGGTLPMPARSSSSPSTTSATLPFAASSPRSGAAGTSLAPAQKRKRGRDDASDISSPAEASDYGEGIKKTTSKQKSMTPTTTKSGRHILKPETYDPAAEDNAKKRNQFGKRTAEQALCKKCMRMHSPATNQMVFCDGCNDPWHQRCHEPWIEDEVVKDQSVNWYCAVCQVKRGRLQPRKKVVVEQPKLVSWAGRSAGQVSFALPVPCPMYVILTCV